ncbi:uncharacterized protein STEHIDRAFT_159249 [Stereum hirsutum FP-91666 SS1]|uniref:uncharacterized protein n=1 Tax=Stereum hirsutum (strain FP-91666) TaxID=721885 RepID=UPI0004449A35|nr:uncharacterized protein STEHIDRAFT_159249 [Stereum hirsutum FP-91666 SS1]EIM84583.1 hypothetical protein STEHIDRAFT_159249 [Stereum hirsutum FP-91666 SS1]
MSSTSHFMDRTVALPALKRGKCNPSSHRSNSVSSYEPSPSPDADLSSTLYSPPTTPRTRAHSLGQLQWRDGSLPARTRVQDHRPYLQYYGILGTERGIEAYDAEFGHRAVAVRDWRRRKWRERQGQSYVGATGPGDPMLSNDSFSTFPVLAMSFTPCIYMTSTGTAPPRLPPLSTPRPAKLPSLSLSRSRSHSQPNSRLEQHKLKCQLAETELQPLLECYAQTILFSKIKMLGWVVKWELHIERVYLTDTDESYGAQFDELGVVECVADGPEMSYMINVKIGRTRRIQGLVEVIELMVKNAVIEMFITAALVLASENAGRPMAEMRRYYNLGRVRMCFLAGLKECVALVWRSLVITTGRPSPVLTSSR